MTFSLFFVEVLFQVAGDDGVVDFMEVENLIGALMNETNQKIESLAGK